LVRSMGRHQVVRLIAVALCAALLGIAGARYLLLRDERIELEESVSSLTLQTSEVLDVFRAVAATRTEADRANTITEAERDRVLALAAAVHADLDRTRADTTAAEIGAYATGAQANNLRACLTGVSQALNQLAVGDLRAEASLRAVETPCRAVGIQ
jgi:hypothetical protein